MRTFLTRIMAAVFAAAALSPTLAQARSASATFDFSRFQIGLEVMVRGRPLYMFLDTGVRPSAIHTALAESLGFKVDVNTVAEAPGEGAASVVAHPTRIDGIALGDYRFGAVDAVAIDFGTISNAYGRPVDGILGQNFLAGKRVLIDYTRRTATFFEDDAEVASQLLNCRVWRTPLKSFPGDRIPVVDLQVGRLTVPASIDTGSSASVALYKAALEEPEVKAATVAMGSTTMAGVRGAFSIMLNRLNVPVGLGPFTVPAGETVIVSEAAGGRDTRLVNVGNQLLAKRALKLLLDYSENRLSVYGDCPA